MLVYIANDHNPYHDQVLSASVIVICLIETSCVTSPDTSPHSIIVLTSHKLFSVFYIRSHGPGLTSDMKT